MDPKAWQEDSLHRPERKAAVRADCPGRHTGSRSSVSPPRTTSGSTTPRCLRPGASQVHIRHTPDTIGAACMIDADLARANRWVADGKTLCPASTRRK